MNTKPLILVLLAAIVPSLGAQDAAGARKKLADAQVAFDAKKYDDSIALAGEAFADPEAGDMSEAGSLRASALVLQGNGYAATGDYVTAQLAFKILKARAKNPVDQAVAKEALLLLQLAADRQKPR